MKKIAAVLAASLVVASFAWAKPLDFSDNDFDFSDSDLETAYVTLTKNDEGGLEIDFSSLEPETSVATVDVEDQVMGYDTDDSTEVFWQESSASANPTTANVLEGVDLAYAGNEFQRVTLMHEGQNYDEVQANYMTALQELGFTLTPEVQDISVANLDSYTLESAGEILRVLFVNQGADTQVTFVQG
jgi:hypothetical protein